jgi:hypothetical protein
LLQKDYENLQRLAQDPKSFAKQQVVLDKEK